jgi:hypothetical protein
MNAKLENGLGRPMPLNATRSDEEDGYFRFLVAVGLRMSLTNRSVRLVSLLAISSGVPQATISPPPSSASGRP